MKNSQKIVLLSVLLVLVYSNRSINFTCRAVDTSICASGFQYRTQGSYENIILDNTYCIPEGSTCDVGTHQFNIQACRVDFKNDVCSTGVCFMQPEQNVCTQDFTCGSQAQPESYQYNYSCGACDDNENCGRCFHTHTNDPDVQNDTEVCLGDFCTEGLSTVTSTVERCPNGKDFFGQPCECCIKTLEISRFCTSNSEALRQAGITNWIKTVDEEDDDLNEKSMLFFGVLLLVIFGMIL